MSTSQFRQFGLIGYPLSHSFSKRYFNEKFEQEGLSNHHYELFPLARIEELPELLTAQPNLVGLNVTIPYKQLVLPFLDEIEEGAAAVGAVNTIHLTEGKLKGYNTDVYGFQLSLEHFVAAQERERPERALILGTGGAARAVAWVLEQLNIDFDYVSRDPQKAALTYKMLDHRHLEQVQLIINTTPLGMAPNVEQSPAIPYSLLGPQHLLYDLVYNPQKTVFLSRGESQGCSIINGLEMLHLQAEKAWEIWQR
ncbi:MAG: shikimate dehydrogenase [Bacteroidota bacterium]